MFSDDCSQIWTKLREGRGCFNELLSIQPRGSGDDAAVQRFSKFTPSGQAAHDGAERT